MAEKIIKQKNKIAKQKTRTKDLTKQNLDLTQENEYIQSMNTQYSEELRKARAIIKDYFVGADEVVNEYRRTSITMKPSMKPSIGKPPSIAPNCPFKPAAPSRPTVRFSEAIK